MVKHSRLQIDEKINDHLTNIIGDLKGMGLNNVSRTDALRFVINMNKAAKIQTQVERKKRSKFGFVIK